MRADFRASVVIPAYNCGGFLAESVESALRQTLPPHEVIVIDDGSTDDTPAVAARFGERIVYHHQPNRGVSAARNGGIDRASGDWLAFLDADDLWEPTKLERVAPVCLSDPRPAIVFTDYRTFGAEDVIHRPSESFRNWNPESDLLVPLVSVMPSAAVVPAGLPVRFVEWAGNDEDAIFFNELSAIGPVRCVPEPLTRYRKHAASAQAKVVAKPTGCENLQRWATEREVTAPGTLRRLFHTLAELAVAARWKRNWPQYWMLRAFCAKHWPADLPRPPVLAERVWPRVAYKLKDAIDWVRGRAGVQA
ncbi:MAG TPA: glycosyltransferase family A protein [Gemmataceae bacterium]|nr:glycosyltransferase family A protein [Gemmataceae bacterium]